MNPASRTAPTTARRIQAGDVIRPRELTTIRAEPTSLPVADGVTHLQFRRFASCPICNVHLRTFTRRHAEIVAAGVHEVAVFHSTVEAMRPHQGDLPFAAVADPEQELYRAFAVKFSLCSVLHPSAWTAVFKPYAWRVAARERRDPGGRWFSLRGDSMMGHPAEFLIEPDGTVIAAKYGKHANDQWSVDDVLEQVRGLG